MNNVNDRLLEIIREEKEDFDMLINADNVLGLNVTSEDIMDYLEFTTSNNVLTAPIIGNIIITEGDILSVLKIIHNIVNYEGIYILYINEDNLGTNSYLVGRANKIYKELNLNVQLELDYSENYNKHINSLVNLIGSKDFVATASVDFNNANKIIV